MISFEAVRLEARRLEALWRIVNTPNLRGDELVLAMLREAAVAIRPGHQYVGVLGHVDGTDFVLEAYGGDESLRAVLPIGSRIPRGQGYFAREFGLRGQIATQFEAAGKVFVLALGTREQEPPETPFGPEDHAYVEILGSFFARHIELVTMQHALLDEREHSRQHAERLGALWRAVNSPNLRGEELRLAMLREAAMTIRPGQQYIGTLGHLEGSTYVADSLVGKFGRDPGAGPRFFSAGRRVDRSELLPVRDPTAGRTQAWDDCQALPNLPDSARTWGVRSMLTTKFVANGTTYVLTLGSQETTTGKPFGAEDYEYIEVLGSFFAGLLEREHMQAVLVAAEARARHHAGRLEELWEVANDPALSGEELMLAMMRRAAAAIRPAPRFRGLLGRIEGDTLLTISAGVDPDDDEPRARRLQIGRRTPLVWRPDRQSGRTRAWNDLSTGDTETDLPRALAALGWRSAITIQFDAAGSTYRLTFTSDQITSDPFDEKDAEYLDVLAAAFTKQLEVAQLEDSLRDEEERSRQHARRLEALWKIVNDSGLKDQELSLAMLRAAAAAIRVDKDFRGMLWRVEDGNFVVEALAHADHLNPALNARVGQPIPLEGSAIGKVVAAGGGTRSWNDIQASADAPATVRTNDSHALIITTFKAGGATWGLSFVSSFRGLEPFEQQDHTYVEVIASFFANHLQQRWQFERIRYQESHDVLTGLLNRSQFRAQARAAARTNAGYAIALLNIDAFREVNEIYGHLVGDSVLAEVADALVQRSSPDEIIGRIGGDVFAIFMPQIYTRDAARNRAVHFAEAFAHSFSTVKRTASLGLSIAPDDGTILDDILLHADTALVGARKRGHGSVLFYEPAMDADSSRRAALRSELARAVTSGEFELYYQPHVELAGGSISGCEALIRWNHPTRGLLLPQDFIPFAEQNGVITSIDRWVMENAFVAAQSLDPYPPNFRIYFNLSGRQAGDPQLLRAFAEAARNGVALERLGVEITETDAMRDIETTAHVCRALQELNVRIAIDDFGTAYSSLSSLKRLPLDIVKIDRSFISGVLNDPHDQTIAETIMGIAARFGFESLAEGVEETEQIDWLRRRGCAYMQGFSICRPLPIGEFKTWLTANGS